MFFSNTNNNFSSQEYPSQYFNYRFSELQQYTPQFSSFIPQLPQQLFQEKSIEPQSQLSIIENENQIQSSIVDIYDSSLLTSFAQSSSSYSQQQIKQFSKNTQKIAKNYQKKQASKLTIEGKKQIKNMQSRKEEVSGLENSFYCPFCSTIYSKQIQNQYRFSRYLHSHLKIHLKNLEEEKLHYQNSKLDEYFTLHRVYSLLIKNWSLFKNQFSSKSQNHLKEIDQIEQQITQKNVNGLNVPISQLTQSIYSLFPLPLTNRIQIDVLNKTASFNFMDEQEYQVNLIQEYCKLGFGMNFDQNYVVVPLQGFQNIKLVNDLYTTNHIKFQIFATSYNDEIYFQNSSKDMPCYFIMVDNQSYKNEPIPIEEFKVFEAEKVYKMFPSDRFYYVIQIGNSDIDRYVITFSNLNKL